MNAHQEVRRLLDQIRVVSNNPAVIKASDQIEVICRSYMAPPGNLLRTATGRHMTGSKAHLFDLLVARRGHLVSREAMLDLCESLNGNELNLKIVDVFICYLRKALIGTKFEGTIETIYGVGFRMKTEEEMAKQVRLLGPRGVNRSACINGHPYTAETTYIHKNDGSKSCKICRALATRAWVKRDKAKKLAAKVTSHEPADEDMAAAASRRASHGIWKPKPEMTQDKAA